MDEYSANPDRDRRDQVSLDGRRMWKNVVLTLSLGG